MPFDPQAFDTTRGPFGDHVHVIARLSQELHAAQSWASSFLDARSRVRHTLPGFQSVALRCPAEALRAIEARSEVVALLPDERVRGFLDHTVERTAVPPLWEEGLTGKDVRLAILDTGIDRGHPDFEGRITGHEDFTGRGVRDDSGHGTFVASVAAGSGEASRGRFRGAAPAAPLLVARVLDAEALGRMSDVMAGMLWALTREARVMCLALGTERAGRPDDALGAAVDQLTAAGVTVCAAAGPDAGAGEPSPACAAGALPVHAWDPVHQPASEPSPGGTETRHLAAPGLAVTASRAYGTQAGKPAGDQYVEASGSSAAAAHVAGVCALLLEAVPEATPTMLAQVLRHSARPIGGGRGAVHAMAALAELREIARRR
ncbi:MAG: S8 family serine peptidase [Candidatus Eisenbacteria bacterium]|nr:S8 family serine peptidase [Candidatus Eisenbacteria bacterium]